MTPATEKAARLIGSGQAKTQKEAAEICGITATHISRLKKTNAKFTELVDKARERESDKARGLGRLGRTLIRKGISAADNWTPQDQVAAGVQLVKLETDIRARGIVDERSDLDAHGWVEAWKRELRILSMVVRDPLELARWQRLGFVARRIVAASERYSPSEYPAAEKLMRVERDGRAANGGTNGERRE